MERSRTPRGKSITEGVLLIECKENQEEMVKDLLWDHHALGVRKLNLDRNE